MQSRGSSALTAQTVLGELRIAFATRGAIAMRGLAVTSFSKATISRNIAVSSEEGVTLNAYDEAVFWAGLIGW